MESSQEDETSKAKAGAREEGGQYIQEEAEVGVFALALLLAYLGQSDTSGSINRLTRSPARFTTVSWKMAEELSISGLPSWHKGWPWVLFIIILSASEPTRAPYLNRRANYSFCIVVERAAI